MQLKHRKHIAKYAGSIAFDAGEGWPETGDMCEISHAKSLGPNVLQSRK
jgi:hypothetical protein